MLEHSDLLRGIVEVDETYIGGKPRRGGPKSKRGRGTRKTPVIGMIERGGRIKAKVGRKSDLTVKKLSSLVRENVDTTNTTLMTDEFAGYIGISSLIWNTKQLIIRNGMLKATFTLIALKVFGLC